MSLSKLLNLQDQEALKPKLVAILNPTLDSTSLLPLTIAPSKPLYNSPQLSKISWFADIIRLRGSIIPTISGPVFMMTLFAAGVAGMNMLWGQHLHLTNSVVPLLSIVVGLLLVFRNGSAYERYSEGRKDFTNLISCARNLTRNIWIYVDTPPLAPNLTTTTTPTVPSTLTKPHLTRLKTELINLVVAYVIATKHHLRAEGGAKGFEELRGLMPERLYRYHLPGFSNNNLGDQPNPVSSSLTEPGPNSTLTNDPTFFPNPSYDIEQGSPRLSPAASHFSRVTHTSASARGSVFSKRRDSFVSSKGKGKEEERKREGIKRRPTAVRIHTETINESSGSPMGKEDDPRSSVSRSTMNTPSKSKVPNGSRRGTERTPLIVTGGIKAGIVPEEHDRRQSVKKREEGEMIRVVELGLPLIIAHEISRILYRFRSLGLLDVIGPAGHNSLQSLLQQMIDLLGAMERVVQTPLPFVFAVHLKQCVSLFLFVLPFTLVEQMGWRMVPLVTVVAFTLMGIEGIATEIEQPFGTDPNDLNLDLYCEELRCEVEYILERMPEGNDVDLEYGIFSAVGGNGGGDYRSRVGLAEDDGDDGGD